MQIAKTCNSILFSSHWLLGPLGCLVIALLMFRCWSRRSQVSESPVSYLSVLDTSVTPNACTWVSASSLKPFKLRKMTLPIISQVISLSLFSPCTSSQLQSTWPCPPIKRLSLRKIIYRIKKKKKYTHGTTVTNCCNFIPLKMRKSAIKILMTISCRNIAQKGSFKFIFLFRIYPLKSSGSSWQLLYTWWYHTVVKNIKFFISYSKLHLFSETLGTWNIVSLDGKLFASCLIPCKKVKWRKVKVYLLLSDHENNLST